VKVKEVAELVGISVRTLHYYDEIGLLTPDQTTESRYRLYSERNIEQLQQILFFRQIGLPLKKIKKIINSPIFDQIEALTMHRKLLIEKQNNIKILINTIDKTIQYKKGEIKMSNKDKLAGFNFDENQYETEARKRWGDKAVNESYAKINELTKEERDQMEKQFDDIYKDLAIIRHLSPDSDDAQAAIRRWWDYLNRIGSYSLEAFKGLGEMYVTDERFKTNINQHGEGLAQFMCDAMRIYSETNEDKNK